MTPRTLYTVTPLWERDEQCRSLSMSAHHMGHRDKGVDMMRKLVCGCFVVALLLPVVAGSAFAQTTGTVSAVTVYQGQALVTRDVRFEAVQGPQEFTGELPEMIVPDSLYATGMTT